MGLFGKSKGERIQEANSQLQELKRKVGDWRDSVLTIEKDVRFRENLQRVVEGMRRDILLTILVLGSRDEEVEVNVEVHTGNIMETGMTRWAPNGKSKGESIKMGLSRINQMIESMKALKEEDIPKDEHEWINTELKKLGLTMLNDLYNIKKTLED